MKNQYVGDVGDFGKYGLLRWLSDPAIAGDDRQPLSVGVIWYLTPDDRASKDGKHITYTDPPNASSYRDCDPALFHGLVHLIRTRSRNVSAVRASGLLTQATRWFDQEVPSGPARGAWFQAALACAHGVDLVFIDPDNGISSSSNASVKHTSVPEWSRLCARFPVVVAYHHLGRNAGGHRKLIGTWLDALQAQAPSHAHYAMHYRRGSARAFFVSARSAADAAIVKERLQGLLRKPLEPPFRCIAHRA